MTNLSSVKTENLEKTPIKKIGSLDQFQFVLYASKDKGLNACDLAVLFEITDRFIKDDGVTFATGVAHLARETGRNPKTVKASRAKLLKHHYLQVGEIFNGTTGTAYIPNFDWSQSVAGAIKIEVAARKAKRKSSKSRKVSGGLPTPTTAHDLVGVDSPPLNDIVGAISPPLRELVGVPRPPHTYVEPTVPYVGGASPPALCLTTTREEPPVEWKIVDSSIDSEAGDTWLNLKLENDDGEKDEAAICLEANDPSRQDAGQKALARLSSSLNHGIQGSEDLHGLWVVFDAQCEIQLAPS